MRVLLQVENGFYKEQKTMSTTQVEKTQSEQTAGKDELVARFNQAFDFHQQGKLLDAIPIYKSILSNDPSHVHTLINLGQALGHSEDKEDIHAAIMYYRKALAQPACPAIAHYNVGNLYQRTGQLEQAIDSYHQALAGDETMHLAWYQLGNVFYSQKMVSKALEAYNKAIAVSQDNPSYFYCRARCYLNQKNYTNAITDASTAMTLCPKNPVPLQSLLGEAYYNIQNYTKAIIHCTLTTRLELNNYNHWLALSVVLKSANREEEAKAVFEKAKQLAPEGTFLGEAV